MYTTTSTIETTNIVPNTAAPSGNKRHPSPGVSVHEFFVVVPDGYCIAWPENVHAVQDAGRKSHADEDTDDECRLHPRVYAVALGSAVRQLSAECVVGDDSGRIGEFVGDMEHPIPHRRFSAAEAARAHESKNNDGKSVE